MLRLANIPRDSLSQQVVGEDWHRKMSVHATRSAARPLTRVRDKRILVAGLACLLEAFHQLRVFVLQLRRVCFLDSAVYVSGHRLKLDGGLLFYLVPESRYAASCRIQHWAGEIDAKRLNADVVYIKPCRHQSVDA